MNTGRCDPAGFEHKPWNPITIGLGVLWDLNMLNQTQTVGFKKRQHNTQTGNHKKSNAAKPLCRGVRPRQKPKPTTDTDNVVFGIHILLILKCVIAPGACYAAQCSVCQCTGTAKVTVCVQEKEMLEREHPFAIFVTYSKV